MFCISIEPLARWLAVSCNLFLALLLGSDAFKLASFRLVSGDKEPF